MTNKLIFIFLINVAVLQSQTFNPIGLNCDELKDTMAKVDNEYFLNHEINLKKGKVVKYEDELKTKTLIYVFNRRDCCQYYMEMLDYLYYDAVLEEFSEYKVFDEDTWIKNFDGLKYYKYLVKEKWYFTIITKSFENRFENKEEK